MEKNTKESSLSCAVSAYNDSIKRDIPDFEKAVAEVEALKGIESNVPLVDFLKRRKII